MLDQKLVAACAIALAVTLFSIFSMRPLARKLGLVDKPGGRKQHSGRIPLIGGLCFFLGTLVGLCYLGYVDHFVMSVVTGATLIMVTGLVDDFHDLSVRSRLLVQVGVVGWVIAVSGIHVDHIGSLLGDQEFRLGLLGIPFTIVAVIGLINAFNMLDGIDGLAAGAAMISIVAMLGFGDFAGSSLGALLLLQILFASLVPYVCVNLGWPDGRKIFMGDAGSTLLGFVLAWSLVYLSHTKVARLEPVDVLWCVAFPVLDTLAVMYRRARSGSSLFKPDRQHFHYLLLDAGCTPRAALLVIMVVVSLLTAVGYGLRDAPQLVSALVFLVALVSYVLWLPRAIKLGRSQFALAFSGKGRASIKLAGFGLGSLRAAGSDSVTQTVRVDLPAETVPSPGRPAALGTHSGVKTLCVMASSTDTIGVAAIVRKLARDERFDASVCIASESKHEAEQVLERFSIPADFNVDIAGVETRAPGITSIALGGMECVLGDAAPDLVVVPGDSVGTLATTLAAYARDVPVVCVSAAGVPSEAEYQVDHADRKIVRTLATLHVASTESVKTELMSEGVASDQVFVAGDDESYRRILEALAHLSPSRIASKATSPRVGATVGSEVESMQKAS